ncbi:hypothetical protein SCA03_23950 [Streptomyces cacaoi]|uniref:Uncharacterized protein n=1 Tax=Streptomyces cacaoi TaxID=1898 RepID=A0A4Y3QWT6_STRCI|nr:hypothetical protein SCA03_23950 [Streptomyces cacaoi]
MLDAQQEERAPGGAQIDGVAGVFHGVDLSVRPGARPGAGEVRRPAAGAWGLPWAGGEGRPGGPRHGGRAAGEGTPAARPGSRVVGSVPARGPAGRRGPVRGVPVASGGRSRSAAGREPRWRRAGGAVPDGAVPDGRVPAVGVVLSGRRCRWR